MESKPRSDERTPEVLLCAPGRGNGAVSEFPGNGKGMWEALHYLFESGLGSAGEHTNNCYSKTEHKFNYGY